MRMILCDDQTLAALSLAGLFESYGHEVVATTDQPDALPPLVEQLNPDICLVDVVTETASSLSATLTSIEACSAKTDVVVLTGSARDPMSTAALASGAAAVVPKSYRSADLVAHVERRSTTPTPTLVRRPSCDRYFLTDRELQVLESLAYGDSTERMVARFRLSHATVRSHVQNILTKLGVHSRSAAVALAMREGLIGLSLQAPDRS